uniref:Ubiquitin-like domain-containing protein n=1 Tax=Buteo japonicus TaxID=224669 RepID=A0A8B9Z617_9AVES
MDLELYGAEEELLGRLDCDEALLGSYPVADGCRVHVGVVVPPIFPSSHPKITPETAPDTLPVPTVSLSPQMR